MDMKFMNRNFINEELATAAPHRCARAINPFCEHSLFPAGGVWRGLFHNFCYLQHVNSAVSSQVLFYDQSGTNVPGLSAAVNLPPGGSTRFTLPDSGPLKVVWGELAAGSGTVEGVATFDLRASNGSLIATAGVLGMQGGNSFLVPVDVTANGSTGVAIANASAGNSVNVRLKLVGENGVPVASVDDSRLNPLDPHAQIADFVTSMFPQLVNTTFKGTLVIEAGAGSAGGALAATALTVKEGLLSALPAPGAAPYPQAAHKT